MSAAEQAKSVPSFCYNCVSGPDFLRVKVENGIATEIEPNFDGDRVHPARGRPCVKAYGLVQKTYNPNRILTPMKRTNPKKGRDEDPASRLSRGTKRSIRSPKGSGRFARKA